MVDVQFQQFFDMVPSWSFEIEIKDLDEITKLCVSRVTFPEETRIMPYGKKKKFTYGDLLIDVAHSLHEDGSTTFFEVWEGKRDIVFRQFDREGDLLFSKTFVGAELHTTEHLGNDATSEKPVVYRYHFSVDAVKDGEGKKEKK